MDELELILIAKPYEDLGLSGVICGDARAEGLGHQGCSGFLEVVEFH